MLSGFTGLLGQSLGNVRLIAANTLRAALRARLGVLLAAVAFVLVAAAHWMRGFGFGVAEIGLLADFGFGVIGLAGTLLAVVLTAQLFMNDLASGAAACVLTRPVRRGEYVAGTLLGIGGALALLIAFLATVLGAALLWRSHQLGAPGVAWATFMGACALQWMKFMVIAAMTLCLSAVARSVLFAICAGLLAVVIGHLRPFATGELEWLRIWPNLAAFDVATLGGGGGQAPDANLLPITLYWSVVCAWLAGVATYVFGFREF